METSQQSNMTQLSRYNARKVRPATACVLRRDNETAPFDNLKKFRSDFPNLPGFSKHTSLRPRSPKVSYTSIQNFEQLLLNEVVLGILFCQITRF